MRFLVIEDNPKLARLIKRGLEEQAYTVDVANLGYAGEDLALQDLYDAIILDIMLPDHDGVDICRNLRRRGLKTPILMLTSLSSTADKVGGLEAGADDYLTKPFELDELLARLRAITRRGAGDPGTLLRFEGIEMDLLQRRVTRDDEKIALTAKEFALLEYFLRNPNRVLSRTQLGSRVWDMNFEEDSNVIEVYVSRLRSKIDRKFERPLLHTVIGTGYILSNEPPAG